MSIPIWAYDYKQRKYVVFPFHLLETFEDGKRGVSWAAMIDNPEVNKFLTKYNHFFTREKTNSPLQKIGLLSLINSEGYRWVLKDRMARKPPGKTDPKWYTKEEAHITKYKRVRK